MLGLRERATFALVCRQCLYASCIIACPFDAIERQDDGIIKRYNLRCVSCKLCAHACPFGTIYPEMLQFYEAHCDNCLGRNEAAPSRAWPVAARVRSNTVQSAPARRIYTSSMNSWRPAPRPG